MWFILKKLFEDVSATVGTALVVIMLVSALFAPYIAPYPEDVAKIHPIQRLKSPSLKHPFGTDEYGRDILSRVIFGTRITIVIVLCSTGLSLIIGVPIGVLAGYYSGWMSGIAMRITDIFLAIPRIILAIAIAQGLGHSTYNVIIALAVNYWAFFARIVYSETMSIKNRLFVESTVAIGARDFRVIALHIFPNLLPSIIIRTTIGMGATILVAATLGFLGLGAQPPAPEWGIMVSAGRHYLPAWWWIATFPGLAIFFIVLAFNMLGDGLRDVIDPKLRRTSKA
jgi:peptide/nickel transport system permease protein